MPRKGLRLHVDRFNLALKTDGTIFFWGMGMINGYFNFVTGATNMVAIATVRLRAGIKGGSLQLPCEVPGRGFKFHNEYSVGVTNVAAIAAGYYTAW